MKNFHDFIAAVNANITKGNLDITENRDSPVSDDPSRMFGEYRLEKTNNPRRQRQGRGNKGSEAQYCFRVYRGDQAFGWIIPIIGTVATVGTEGKPIGYSFHYEDPHRDGFRFYAFTYGSMKKALDALKNKYLT